MSPQSCGPCPQYSAVLVSYDESSYLPARGHNPAFLPGPFSAAPQVSVSLTLLSVSTATTFLSCKSEEVEL